MLDAFVFYLSSSFITEEVMFAEFNRYLDTETALSMAENSQTKVHIALKYVIHLLLLILKVGGISILLYAGLFLANRSLSWIVTMGATVKYYPLFFVTDVLRFTYFSFMETSWTYAEFNGFNPLSLGNLIQFTGLSFTLFTIKFLSAFNLLDFIFCYLIAVELSNFKETESKRITATVFTTYLTVIILLRLVQLLIVP